MPIFADVKWQCKLHLAHLLGVATEPGTTNTGFVVGGGVDYKVAPHLSLGLEGLYYDFGSQNTSLNAGDEPFVLKDDENFATVRGRLTYHFDSSY